MEQVTEAVSLQLKILTGAVGLLVVIVGVVGAYLRLYLANALGKMEDKILQGVKVEFARKETSDLRFTEIERRLNRTEARVESVLTNKVVDGST